MKTYIIIVSLEVGWFVFKNNGFCIVYHDYWYLKISLQLVIFPLHHSFLD